MMKMSSRINRIRPTIAAMTIPATPPSERLRDIGGRGWVVGTVRGEMLSPVNPLAAKLLLDLCVQ